MFFKNILIRNGLFRVFQQYGIRSYYRRIDSGSKTAGPKTAKVNRIEDGKEKPSSVVPHEFRHVFPEFLTEPDFRRRHAVTEKLEKLDMLKRRMQLDIPEFYVGSILAITCSDAYAPKRTSRFVGICIERELRGLHHRIQLRNVIDGIAMEVPYDLYNPLIQSIQVLRLEKRPDEHLLYLRDALLEYSTFPFDMQAESLPPGAPVPVNMLKVKMKPQPWTKKWHIKQLYGIEEFQLWDHLAPLVRGIKRKYLHSKLNLYEKYDIVGQYRRDTSLQDQQEVYEQALDFEKEHQLDAKRPVGGRRITTVGGFFKKNQGKAQIDLAAKPKSITKK